jgi:hypothetical protein
VLRIALFAATVGVLFYLLLASHIGVN